MPWVRRFLALLLIQLASRSPGPSSRCAARPIAACESLTTGTVFTPCCLSHFLLLTVSPSPSPIANGSASTTSIRPVPRYLRRVPHSSQCLHTAAVPTRRLSQRDASVHPMQTPAPTFASFSLAQYFVALLAGLLSSSIMVLTSGFSPGAGQLMSCVARPCLCAILTTRHIGVPDKGSSCSSFSLQLHAFASLAANHC